MATGLVAHDELLTKQFEDPHFRAYWERTAFPRGGRRSHQVSGEHGLSQRAHRSSRRVPGGCGLELEPGEHAPKLVILRKPSQMLSMRFLLEIHPTGQSDQSTPTANGTNERVTVDDVELLVRAS